MCAFGKWDSAGAERESLGGPPRLVHLKRELRAKKEELRRLGVSESEGKGE